jgi:hypothetical protein
MTKPQNDKRGARRRPSLLSYSPADLPAWFAAIAATTTAAARAPATSAATAAGTTAATPAAKSTAAASAAAKSAVRFRTGFVHVQRASIKGVSVESGNGLIRLAFIFHLDECETAGTAGFTICHDSGAVYLAVPLKEAAYTLFGGIEVQVAYEYVLHSSLLSI